MTTPEEHYDRLRALQLEQDGKLSWIQRALQDIRNIEGRGEAQRRELHQLIRQHGADLVELQMAMNRLENRVAILEHHPSNAAGQYRRLSHKGRKGYVTGVASILAGAALLVFSGGVEYSRDGEGARVNFNEVPAPLMVMALGLLLGKQAVEKEMGNGDQPE